MQRQRRRDLRAAATLDQRAQYLRTPDVAKYLGVSPRTVESWRLEKKGPPWQYLPETRAVVYDVEELARWAAGRPR